MPHSDEGLRTDDRAERRGPVRAVILARGLGTRMRKPDDSATLDPNQAAAADLGV